MRLKPEAKEGLLKIEVARIAILALMEDPFYAQICPINTMEKVTAVYGSLHLQVLHWKREIDSNEA